MKVNRFLGLTLAVLIGATVAPRGAGPAVRYLRHAEVRDLLAGINDDLSPELQALPTEDEDQWFDWISQRDSDIRARLGAGDQEMLVNWLLLGGSFTSQPRLSITDLVDPSAKDPQVAQRQAAILGARMDDFLRALTTPGTDARRVFAQKFFAMNGFGLRTADEQAEFKQHLLESVQSAAVEFQLYAERFNTAAQAGGATTELVMASLFQEKGLSADAPLAPNYSINASLVAMKSAGLIKPGSVARVAIVGPGVSFSEADTGFDEYPSQMLQPFAVLDALRQLQLAPTTGGVDVVAFDISPRVIAHLTDARDRAVRGQSYTLNLPLAKDTSWLPAFRAYWMNFGSQIAPGGTSPTASADFRAIKLPPATVQQVSISNLNIVTQRLDEGAFDLMIVTNVLPYYDRLSQALAVSNMEAMVKPGGFLLSNTALPAVRTTFRPLRALNVPYTMDNRGDRIIWYQRQ